jgi:ubiquinone/menaquinone biosynthesis C-methylase UbiE
MTTTIEGAAYDVLAPSYDLLTADYDHDRWIGALLAWAREHGLDGRRALDVACGTGRSFVPLLAAGFEVVACDESRGMLNVAATKVPDPRAIRRHDMRALPVLGSFDLVTCIDDAPTTCSPRPTCAPRSRRWRATWRRAGCSCST